MAFPHPNKFSTTHKDLKHKSNMMAIYYEFALHQKFENLQKRFDNLNNLQSHISMQNKDFTLIKIRNFMPTKKWQ